MSSVQQQPQTPDAKKIGSDGEDFSDTANETATFEVIHIIQCLQTNLFFTLLLIRMPNDSLLLNDVSELTIK